MASMNFDCEALRSVYNAYCAASPADNFSKPVARRRCNEQEESDAEPAKCRYAAGVLVGDWFERRADYEAPRDDWRTVYDTTYTCKLNEDLEKNRTALRDNKIRAERGLGAEFLVDHLGKTFYGNFATTNDLLFRVMPRGLCGPQTRKYSSRKDKWLPEIDLTKNFGNLTNYGLAEAVECENYMNSRPSPRETIQKRDFKKPETSVMEPVKRFPKPKGITNEPYLCHLDIDPDLPFRPHLIKTKM